MEGKCDICGELNKKKKFRQIIHDHYEEIVVKAIAGVVGMLVLGAGLIVWDQSFAAKRQVGLLSGQMASVKLSDEAQNAEIQKLKETISNFGNALITEQPREE